MTIRETTIAKLQQLPEPILQEVSDFIDFIIFKYQREASNSKPQDDIAQAWAQWFETVERLEMSPTEPT